MADLSVTVTSLRMVQSANQELTTNSFPLREVITNMFSCKPSARIRTGWSSPLEPFLRFLVMLLDRPNEYWLRHDRLHNAPPPAFPHLILFFMYIYIGIENT